MFTTKFRLISASFSTPLRQLHQSSRLLSATPTPESGKPNITLKAKSFETLLRSSPLVQLGMPEGKIVVGEIIDVVGSDLYVDFGFKFPGVVKTPRANSSSFIRGAQVKVRINDLELSDRFLGSNIDMTLLEADITLLGLISSPVPKEYVQKESVPNLSKIVPEMIPHSKAEKIKSPCETDEDKNQ